MYGGISELATLWSRPCASTYPIAVVQARTPRDREVAREPLQLVDVLLVERGDVREEGHGAVRLPLVTLVEPLHVGDVGALRVTVGFIYKFFQ